MSGQELDSILDALFIGQLHVDDMIELEKQGFPSGFKKACLSRDLKKIKAAIGLVQRQLAMTP